MKDGDTPPARPALSGQDVLRFFMTKLPKLSCPACGGEEFHVQTGQSHYTLAIPVVKDGSVLPDRHASIAVVMCQNCFYMLQFSEPSIAKWLAQKEAETPNG